MKPTLLMASTIWLFSLSTSLQALEWSSIIKKDDYEIFVDIDSYAVLDGMPYMTTKTVYIAPQIYLSNPESFKYHTRLDQLQYDCESPRYKHLQLKLLNASGEVMLTDSHADNFRAIPLDSDTFSVGQLTCQVHQMLGGSNK